MKRSYRIRPQTERDRLSDPEIARHRDASRLLFAYQRATSRPRRPLYRDPRAFITLLLIVLLAIFIAEVIEKERVRDQPTPREVRP